MTQLGVQPTAPHHPQLTNTGFRVVSRELFMDPNLETPYFEGHKQGKQIICLRFLFSAPIQHGGLNRAWDPCAEMYNSRKQNDIQKNVFLVQKKNKKFSLMQRTLFGIEFLTGVFDTINFRCFIVQYSVSLLVFIRTKARMLGLTHDRSFFTVTQMLING